MKIFLLTFRWLWSIIEEIRVSALYLRGLKPRSFTARFYKVDGEYVDCECMTEQIKILYLSLGELD